MGVRVGTVVRVSVGTVVRMRVGTIVRVRVRTVVRTRVGAVVRMRVGAVVRISQDNCWVERWDVGNYRLLRTLLQGDHYRNVIKGER